jgi:Neuraminidase (sialidase)
MRRHFLGVLLISALTVTTAVAGTYPASPLVAASQGSSPFTSCAVGADTNSTLYTSGEVEPSVATNPSNVLSAVGAWQQDRWSDGGSKGVSSAYTTDGGQTWVVNPLTHTSTCSGGPSYERATDPWVTFTPNGTAFLFTASFNQVADLTNAMLVTKSTDGGATWGAPTTLIRDTNPHVFNDKNSITADPNHEGYVYATWDRLVYPNERTKGKSYEHAAAYKGPTYFTRTLDGGATWEAAHKILDPGRNNQTIGNQIAVLPHANGFNGELINVFDLINNRNKQGLKGLRVAVMRSSDHGATWGQPIIVGNLGTAEVIDPDTGHAVRTGDIIPDIAVDPISGTIYVVWQDARVSNGDHDGIVLSKSTDGGLTWSEPVQVNQAPQVPAFTAAVEVTSDGTVGVSYYDFRFNTTDPNSLLTDHWLVHSHDGGLTWSETRITPTSFDMQQAPDARGYFLGDYEGLDNIGADFLSFFARGNSSTDPSTIYSSVISP